MEKIKLARIKTANQGWICCIDDMYGKFRIFFTDKNMVVSRPANVAEWMWATSSWGQQLEFLENIPDTFSNVPCAEFPDRVNYPHYPALQESSVCWRNETEVKW